MNKTIDILLYVDRLDTYRVDNLDKQIVKAITESFGKEIWERALVVLTHAQLSPPDGLEYDVFFTRRSEALLKIVRSGARIRKQDTWVNWSLPKIYLLTFFPDEPCAQPIAYNFHMFSQRFLSASILCYLYCNA